MADLVTQQSKFLSYVLRHAPESIGLTLDSAGWVEVETLLAAAQEHRQSISLERLAEIVDTNNKKRFEFSHDGLNIRARQGHSVEIDLQLSPETPPATLYHGTATRFLNAIREQGLVKGQPTPCPPLGRYRDRNGSRPTARQAACFARRCGWSPHIRAQISS